MIRRVAAVIGALCACTSLLVACSGSPSVTSTARVTTTTAALATVSDGLTGFGATVAAWNAAHQADQDSSLVKNCCYLPKIKFYGQSGLQDTWAAVLTADNVIYGFTHDFAPHTTEAEATAAIRREDLPPDAQLVQAKVGDGCKLFLYRSAELAAAQPTLGAYISVFYESPPDGTVYTASNIWDAGVMSSDADIGSC